jgi:Uma2 family endonuclease
VAVARDERGGCGLAAAWYNGIRLAATDCSEPVPKHTRRFEGGTQERPVSTITPTEPTTISAEAAPPAPFVSYPIGDLRTVFRGVDWHTYNQLSQATGEGQHVHLIFDGKDLEIMVVGNIHERFKEWLGLIVRAVIMGRDLDCVGCGETTWKTLTRGLEADLSYYFDAEKVRIAEAAMARGSLDPADYPRPDLAIEIDMWPPQVDRAAVYMDLGVAEVWRLIRGEELIIEQLQPDGSYVRSDESKFLHIRADVVLKWLNETANEREASWNRRLNQWAMELGRHA